MIIRSVHNVRIERLWRDVTANFGARWKEVFQTLEHSHGLDVDNTNHIWLLHFLFLDAINVDAQNWAEMWNNHTLSIRGEPHHSPKGLFLQGMIENGMRGLSSSALDPTSYSDDDDAMEDLDGYGIDWVALDDPNIRSHQQQNAAHSEDIDSPLHEGLHHSSSEDAPCSHFSSPPIHLSHVEVPIPNCPFSDAQVSMLEQALYQHPAFGHHDINAKCELWDYAKRFCEAMPVIDP